MFSLAFSCLVVLSAVLSFACTAKEKKKMRGKGRVVCFIGNVGLSFMLTMHC